MKGNERGSKGIEKEEERKGKQYREGRRENKERERNEKKR